MINLVNDIYFSFLIFKPSLTYSTFDNKYLICGCELKKKNI